MDEINFESELDSIFEQELPEETAQQEEFIEETPAEEIPVKKTPKAKPAKKTGFDVTKILKNTAKKPAPRRAMPKMIAPENTAAAVAKTASAVPQRRPRLSKQDQFKQTLLPLIILAVAALLIVIFIIGSITRAVQKHQVEKEASIAVSESIAEEQALLEKELNTLLLEAEKLAASYDYDGAIAVIDSFSGNIGGYPKLQDIRTQYEYSRDSLVPWEDPNTIVNLSLQTLIVDSNRAFAHEDYGSSLKRNFITVTEFHTLLERLYENNYILVGIDDFIQLDNSGSGAPTYEYKELLLPAGKKPIVLTQTNVNYNLYLVDSDNDLIADKDGVGVASKLVLDSEGKVTCEFVESDGSVSTGAYDLVPILDAFIEQYPDFSYRGAKAVLALTGYNGLFGYRTNPEARAVLGEEQYEKDVASVKAVAEALTASGYNLACYTYSNNAYGNSTLAFIQGEINKWNDEVAPILGTTDIMVFAQNSDINSGVLYSGEKFEYLKSVGFNIFLGFCNEGDPFTFIADDYVRQGRLLVTGSNLEDHAGWFEAIFKTDGLLEPARNKE